MFPLTTDVSLKFPKEKRHFFAERLFFFCFVFCMVKDTLVGKYYKNKAIEMITDFLFNICWNILKYLGRISVLFEMFLSPDSLLGWQS